MNPLRNLLLHVDSSELSLVRLKAAQALATALGTELTALYAVTPWLLRYPVPLDAGSVLVADMSELDRQRLERAKAAFSKATVGMPTVRWTELGSQPPYDFAQRALYADLLVLGQHCESDPAHVDVPSDFVSSVVIHSGKPTLVVPHTSASPVGMPARVLVAWNASRESARAVSAALPFLQQARQVDVAVWTGPEDGEPGEGVAIEAYLRQHGVTPVLHRGQTSSRDVGDPLLSLACDVGADWLVMGCYGHGRAREWVLGGTTRTVLKTMTLPVLMTH